MNVSYKWLKEYVDFDLTPQETADALTSCGLEVDALEEVQSIKGGLKGLYVGKVLTCEMHPNSDHLHVTTMRCPQRGSRTESHRSRPGLRALRRRQEFHHQAQPQSYVLSPCQHQSSAVAVRKPS